MLWPSTSTLNGKEESTSMLRRGSCFSLNGHPKVAQHGAGKAGHEELSSVNEEDGSEAAPLASGGSCNEPAVVYSHKSIHTSCNEPAVDTPKAHLAKRPGSAPSTAR